MAKKDCLTAGRFRDLFHYDQETGAFTRLKRRIQSKFYEGSQVGTINDKGFVAFAVDGRRYLAYDLAWLYMTGQFPVVKLWPMKDGRKHRRDNSWGNIGVKNVAYDNAKRSGDSRYLDRDPCDSGHIGERYTCNKMCVQCQADRVREFRKSKPEVCRSYVVASKPTQQRYYQENRVKILEACKDYAAKNKDRIKARARKLYEKQYDERLAYNREWRAANPDKAHGYSKRWRGKNPEKVNEWRQRRNAALIGQVPSWADIPAMQKVYKEAKRLTKETGIDHDVDHIVPLQGKTVCGLHVHINLQILTSDQNVRKANKLLPEVEYGFAVTSVLRRAEETQVAACA